MKDRARQSCCREQRKLPGEASSLDCRAVDCDPVSGQVYGLPVKSTAETGCEVNQSGSCSPFTHAAVVPCPYPVLAEGEAGREGMPLNDMEFSITQHDDTDCKQFGSAVGRGPSTPSSTDDEVNFFSSGRFEQCTGLPGGKKFCTSTQCQVNCQPVEFSPMTCPKGRHV